ncbi:ABC transporter permease [Terrimonas sp. NA20]|uniref:ABC transporter permease n=1 Tax=Terrimonas ginsenosidimutans TaxID=2908004 RepID=A0ABS9KKR9_9BACT|nr:ABC transporter permease [Terrimonas ginsenosidimutans]MCG2612914.1 ABC transporter permease [Terrimonas ginsenosidimutans]
MLKNYFKIAWRNLWKNKSFSLINILGLALGIASSLLIIFHVKEELNYDKGFSNADRIFRVTQEGLGNDTRHWAATPFPLGTMLQKDLPEVEQIVRLHKLYPYQLLSYTNVKGEAKRFQEKGGLFADSNTLKMFDFPLLKGNADIALSKINSVVISEQFARKYFGDDDPIGKILQDEKVKQPLTVTGVLKKTSFNSHLDFDYLVSMSTLTAYMNQEMFDRRTWSGFHTYVMLREGSVQKAASKIPAFTGSFYAEPGQTISQVLASTKLNLQPITSIHLHSRLEKELRPNSDITYIYIFSVAAFLILLLASVNFVNVFTAQAFNRMKEIGLRKVIGASKSQLVKQFLGESLLTTILAAVLALGLFYEALPFYNELTDKNFRFDQLIDFQNLLLLGGLILLIALLSGAYPAWFVAKFNPVNSLKGKRDSLSTVNVVRKSLIVFQFAVAVFMIFSTVVVYRQMKLFHNKDLGFDKEQLVAVTMYENMWQKFGALLGELKKDPAIEETSVTSTLPGERFSMLSFSPVNAATGAEDLPGTRTLMCDEDLLKTLNVPVVQGRNFVSQFPQIKRNEFILNEAAVKLYKMADPVGQQAILDIDTGEVVGVIKDFNFASLHSSVEPLVLQYNPYRANYLLLKVQPEKLKASVANMAIVMKQMYPESLFTYTFLDEKLDQLYSSENKMSQIIQLFAILAIFISAVGLFGLSAYSIRLRVKEVGIRKTLGASVAGVVLLLSKDFVKLVAIAIVIAWPIAWWATSRWLDAFAYRVDIGWLVFGMSGLFALAVGVTTVSFEAVKAAVSDPVRSLKAD